MIMIGLPGSGKTTATKYLKDEGYVVHSSDAIREEFFGDEYNRDDNKFVFSTMFKRTKRDLEKDYNVVYDATNLSRKLRRNLINQLRKYAGRVEGMLMLRSYEDIIKYNKKRNFPMDVLFNYIRYFNIPNKQEGFDEINVSAINNINTEPYNETEDSYNTVYNFIKSALKGEFNKDLYPYLHLFNNYNQNTPYHSLTLDEHLQTVYEESLKFKDKEVTIAALFHDIGKTKTRVENKHGHSSYYGHENVSAYMFLLLEHKYNLSNRLYFDLEKVLDLISFHMRMHQLKTTKAKRKLIKEVGQDVYPHLCELYVCDLAGK